MMKQSWWKLATLVLVGIVAVAMAEGGKDKPAPAKKKAPPKAPAMEELNLTGTVVEETYERKNPKTGETTPAKRLILKTDDGQTAMLPPAGMLKRTSPEFTTDLTTMVGKKVVLVGKGNKNKEGVYFVRAIKSLGPADGAPVEVEAEEKPAEDDAGAEE